MSRPEPEIPALERLLRRLLLGGATASALCLTIGLGAWLISPGAGAGRVLLQIGLITLMVTPVTRIAVAVVEAIRIRDWVFVATTLAVIAVLGATLVFTLTRARVRAQPNSQLPPATSRAGSLGSWELEVGS
ncbi:MAG TPA: DUF1634 domain-containing protein [Vicinamibacterales bacterium]|nr:DUF1634 domain-containing protein [Vicinamibacterales bacterium]